MTVPISISSRTGHLAVFADVLRARRRSLVGWSIGIAETVGLLVAAYPTVRGNSALDRSIADLPEGIKSSLALGDSSISSPVGYLNSQLFANVLPILLLVFAIGFAARAVAGDEEDGRLELILANPLTRTRLVLERAGALIVGVAVLSLVAGVVLVATAGLVDIDEGTTAYGLLAASIGAGFLALAHAALALATGCATGRRGTAIAAAAAVATLGFVLQGLGAVEMLSPLRSASPWHWLIDGDPLANGLGWRTAVLPTVVTIVLVAVAVVSLEHRDLR